MNKVSKTIGLKIQEKYYLLNSHSVLGNSRVKQLLFKRTSGLINHISALRLSQAGKL